MKAVEARTESGLSVVTLDTPVPAIQDKRMRGPREEPKDHGQAAVHVLADILSGWAVVLLRDPQFTKIRDMVPRPLRRQLMTRFAKQLLKVGAKAPEEEEGDGNGAS
jgi:hypothetical protein